MKTTKWLTLLLALCAALVIVPWMGGAARAEGEVLVNTWEELQTAMKTDNSIKLNNDIAPTENDSGPLEVAGVSVSLDLNGHTINRGLNAAPENGEDGCVIKIYNGGQLTLNYNSTTGGTITGGFSNEYGGGIYVQSGSLIMYGGTITGNKAAYGGGVYVGGSCGFQIAGNVVIDHNSDGTEESNPNNVYLTEGTYITLNDALAIGTRIGITTETKPEDDEGNITRITVTNMWWHMFEYDEEWNVITTHPAEYLFSDDPAYAIRLNDNEAEMVPAMTWSELKEVLENAGENETITLTNNVTREEGEDPINLSLLSCPIKLDLNGFTLDAGDQTAIKIECDCTLTITDSSSKQTGKIIGTDKTIALNGNNAALILAGGTIECGPGGVSGVYLNDNTGTKFKMTGGTIQGYAYGVSVHQNTVFEMTGGTITDNYTGVSIDKHFDDGYTLPTFRMYGGTISGNGTGVSLGNSTSVFEVSDSPVILSNEDSDVTLNEGAVITVTGKLGTDAKIGVTTGTAPTAETPITITSGLSGNGSVSSFFSDNPAYVIDTDESGEAVLCLSTTGDNPETVYTVTLLPGEGTGDPIVYSTETMEIAPDISYANNNGFYSDGDGVVFLLSFDWPDEWQAPAGRYFSGLFDADNGEEYKKDDFLPCDPSITLTARYAQQASFELSPADFSLTPSDFDSEGYTSLGIKAESLVLGVLVNENGDTLRAVNELSVEPEQGTLTCGDSALSFQVYTYISHSGDGNRVRLQYEEEGKTSLFDLSIDPAALRDAAPGTYTGFLNCGIKWEPGGVEAATVSIPLTLVVPEPEPKPAFTVHSLVLSGEIGVNFFMDLPEIDGVDYSTSYMEFTVSGKDGKTTQDNYDPAQKSKSGEYYGFTCYVNSIQMADTITATFHYTQGTENKTVKQEYSVKDYLDTISNGTFSDEMKALGVAIGSYGYYAQTYLAYYHGFSLGTDHAAMPAGTEYTDSDYTEAKNGVSELTIVRDTGSSGIVNVSYALVLDSSTGIYIYLEPADDYTGEVTAVIGQGTENAAVKQSDGRYRIHISGISAHKLADMYSITVTAGDTFTIRVSALSYVDTMLNSDTASDKVKNLVVALYQYHEKAMAYKASIQ